MRFRCSRFLIVSIACLLLDPSISLAKGSTEKARSHSPFWASSWFLGGVGVSVVVGAATGFVLGQRSRSNGVPESSNELDVSQVQMQESDSQNSAVHGSVHHQARSNHSGLESEVTQHQLQNSIALVTKEPAINETSKLAKIDIVDELIQELRLPDPTKRHKAIWELGQRGDTRAVQPLVDLLIDSDSKQHSLILSALSEIGVRTLKPMTRALAISLQDENTDVRKNAIRDLTRMYDGAAQLSQLLQKATSDSDPEVRDTAGWALNQLNRIRSLPEIPRSQERESNPPGK